MTTLDEIVEYYSQQLDGLCCSLTAICPRVPPSIIGLSYKDEWNIEKQSITLNKKIGYGDFGYIWEGLWNQSTPVIVEAYGASSLDIKKLQDEIHILKKIQHSNILQFYGASAVTECTVGEPIYIITEFINNANILIDYLRKGSSRYMKLPQMIDIATQVASGMAYLEAHDYVHRNLSANNVLINEAVTISSVKIKLSLHRNEGTNLSVRWTAPEAALHNSFSIKSDVWSFGILLTELVTHGQWPYPGMTNSEVLSKILEGYRMPPPPGCPDPLYQTMQDCWKEDPEQRPPFEYLQYSLGDYFVLTAEVGGYREPA